MSTVKTAILASLFSGHLQSVNAEPGAAPAASPIQLTADADGLDELQARVETLLAEAGFEAAVSSRVKSPESLRAKMLRKGFWSEEQVLDRLAVRVRVDTEAQAYAVFNQLLARFPAVPGSADDYIASPKANGYQSLHAAAYTPSGVVEFQVRTHAMHEHAEHGAAAHWRYKHATLSAVS